MAIQLKEAPEEYALFKDLILQMLCLDESKRISLNEVRTIIIDYQQYYLQFIPDMTSEGTEQ